jgi:putative FmdB family regulatory protein
MPIFEYICQECKQHIEVLIYGAQKPECPHCGGQKLEPKLSVFAVAARSAGTPSPSVPCSTCGDPRGAGACSMPDLD